VLVLLVLVISYASSLRAWVQQRSEISDTRVEISRTSAEVDALEQERLRWEDPAYIAQQARERFGWVLPGEVGYRVIGADGATLGAPRAPDSLPAPPSASRAWYDDVWGSIAAAGEVPETAAEPPPPREGVIAPPSGRGARHR